MILKSWITILIVFCTSLVWLFLFLSCVFGGCVHVLFDVIHSLLPHLFHYGFFFLFNYTLSICSCAVLWNILRKVIGFQKMYFHFLYLDLLVCAFSVFSSLVRPSQCEYSLSTFFYISVSLSKGCADCMGIVRQIHTTKYTDKRENRYLKAQVYI